MRFPECVQNHRKENKLSQKRNDQGSGWNDLGQQEKEHSKGEKDGYGEADLGMFGIMKLNSFPCYQFHLIKADSKKCF